MLYFCHKDRTKKGIMANKIIKIIITAFIIPSLFYTPASFCAEIIANSNLFQEKISIREVRSIFSLKLRQWRTGERIIIVSYSDKNAGAEEQHAIFCKNVLKIFPHQLQLAWDRVTYSGIGISPKKVDSVEQMIEFISKTKGAIGYVDSESIDVDSIDGIKVIKVE